MNVSNSRRQKPSVNFQHVKTPFEKKELKCWTTTNVTKLVEGWFCKSILQHSSETSVTGSRKYMVEKMRERWKKKISWIFAKQKFAGSLLTLQKTRNLQFRKHHLDFLKVRSQAEVRQWLCLPLCQHNDKKTVHYVSVANKLKLLFWKGPITSIQTHTDFF